MNAHRKSPKLLVTAALALVAAACLAAAGIRAGREGTRSRPDTTAHARQSTATSGDASAALRVQSLTLRGGQLREAGRYQVALPLLQEALALAEGAFGPDSLEAADVLNQLGMLGKSDRRFDEAEAAFRRALAIYERTLPPSHPKLVTCRENYERLLRELKGRM
ncbi:MAG TPA: tetratricopeptide repeat protein [Pyrinomonadaceae bacterium]